MIKKKSVKISAFRVIRVQNNLLKLPKKHHI
jgi:hypothetical protein